MPLGALRSAGVKQTVGDPHFSNVIALIPFNGVDGATTATDYSSVGRVLTFGGSAQIDTAISKFGGGSVMLDGVDAYVEMPDTPDLTLHSTSTEAFTIEFWAYFPVWPDASSGFGYMIGQYDAGSSQRSWAVLNDPSGGFVRFNHSANGVTFTQVLSYSNTNISAATWYHIAYDFDGTSFRAYVNGIVVSTLAGLPAWFNASTNLRIGARGDAILTGQIRMHMEELRLTKAVARYAGAFTPPAAPFPR